MPAASNTPTFSYQVPFLPRLPLPSLQGEPRPPLVGLTVGLRARGLCWSLPAGSRSSSVLQGVVLGCRPPPAVRGTRGAPQSSGPVSAVSWNTVARPLLMFITWLILSQLYAVTAGTS